MYVMLIMHYFGNYKLFNSRRLLHFGSIGRCISSCQPKTFYMLIPHQEGETAKKLYQ